MKWMTSATVAHLGIQYSGEWDAWFQRYHQGCLAPPWILEYGRVCHELPLVYEKRTRRIVVHPIPVKFWSCLSQRDKTLSLDVQYSRHLVKMSFARMRRTCSVVSIALPLGVSGIMRKGHPLNGQDPALIHRNCKMTIQQTHNWRSITPQRYPQVHKVVIYTVAREKNGRKAYFLDHWNRDRITRTQSYRRRDEQAKG